MSTEIASALDKFEGLISRFRSDTEAGVKVQVDAAKDALRSELLSVQQAQAAASRASVESSVGTERELGGYIVRSAPVEARDQYMRAKDSAVRLGGHFAHSTTPAGDTHRQWQWGLLDDPEPRSKGQLELQRAVTERSLGRAYLRRSNGARNVHTPHLDSRVMDAARACGGEISKIFADSAGIGAEWVPDTYLPELERDVEVETGVRSIFRQRALPPGGVKIPQRSGRLRVNRHATPTTDYPAVPTLATLTTSNSQIDPVSAYVGVQVDRDMEEDSIVPIMAELRKEMAAAISFAEDDTILHGDDAATHQDTISTWDNRGELGSTGLGTPADHRRRWLGLRARAYDLFALDSAYGKTDQNASQTFAGMRAALVKLGTRNLTRGAMGKSDIVVLVSFEYFFNKMLDSTAFSEFITFEKVGALASVLTGQLGNVAGTPGGLLPGQVGFLQGFIPVCVAWPIGSDFATSGLYTGSGATTGFVCVDRSRFEYCVRKGAMLEVDTSVLANTQTLLMRYRTKFRPIDATAATVRDVHWSYNL